jgi:hypothetical protein
MNNGRDCEHGQLARSCDRCADAAKVAELREELPAERDEWQSAVFTLMGHAASLYMEGKHDMPAWCYALAEKIARAHLDETQAQRVRLVAVQQRAKYGEPA